MYLIWELCTVDGKRNSAKGLLDFLNQEEIKKLKKKKKKLTITKDEEEEITEKNEHKIFKKVYLKYLLMKIRAKISYMALLKR